MGPQVVDDILHILATHEGGYSIYDIERIFKNELKKEYDFVEISDAIDVLLEERLIEETKFTKEVKSQKYWPGYGKKDIVTLYARSYLGKLIETPGGYMKKYTDGVKR